MKFILFLHFHLSVTDRMISFVVKYGLEQANIYYLLLWHSNSMGCTASFWCHSSNEMWCLMLYKCSSWGGPIILIPCTDMMALF